MKEEMKLKPKVVLIFARENQLEVVPEEYKNLLQQESTLNLLFSNLNVIKIGQYEFYKETHRINLDGKDITLITLNPIQKDLSAFFSKIIHEIKNPIAAIKALIQLASLELESESPDRDKIRRCHRNVLYEINRMTSLLTSIHNLSKPRSRFIREFDLVSTVRKAVNIWIGEARKRNVKLRIITNSSRIKFVGDDDEIHQIINNLIKNSIEAVEKVESPLIEVELKEEEDKISLIVRDNGIGMEKEMLEKLGTEFFSSKEDGFGLGLFIVKTIVNQYGGTINIDSEPGKGTTVTLLFPSVK